MCWTVCQVVVKFTLGKLERLGGFRFGAHVTDYQKRPPIFASFCRMAISQISKNQFRHSSPTPELLCRFIAALGARKYPTIPANDLPVPQSLRVHSSTHHTHTIILELSTYTSSKWILATRILTAHDVIYVLTTFSLGRHIVILRDSHLSNTRTDILAKVTFRYGTNWGKLTELSLTIILGLVQ